ncbi:Acetyltransferase (GNAT) family protein [Candidatus Brocadiaceae bacterium B188]|nr:GNAT family N-acetyltransferase [Candidatus Brocadia sapporoensis]QQR66098.1 MAG: GNAT family N-acetyltransferase [Candidatus Brocadia sp.]RZV57705.1 MAG: GNAT family N-acetyltransferase [Candidatus Brocadia sp. BROELEC01]TWU53016.1 Acetyltransferase (GNAT) family protein [Candidatus Brocadiaceae bacterium B188]
MNITLRPGNAADALPCGTICYEAFKTIARQHNFPPDFPSPAFAIEFLSELLTHPGIYAAVAEFDGRIVGSNFLDERSTVAGIGPITVDPAMQNRTVGRQLMQHILDRATQRRFPGVRLIQAAYHNRSLSLYTRLGFVAREPLANLQGEPLDVKIPGYTVRPATEQDLDACNRICVQVHGHDRSGELHDAIRQGTATIVEHGGRITGYATPVAFFGHAIGETNEALKALIGAAPTFPGPGFLLPIRNGELFRWCLDHRLRVVQPMTLMSMGLYNEPAGAFLPSILY